MKNYNFFIFMLLFSFGKIFAQCDEGAVPTDYSLVDEDFFNNYNPPAAPAGTEALTINPQGGNENPADGSKNLSGILIEIDGHSSIQIKQNGKRHFYNSNYGGGASSLSRYDDKIYTGFALLYKGKIYHAKESNIDFSTSYINKSISQITGDGSVSNPWKAKIEFFADINGNGAYEPEYDILVTEIITLEKQNNFFRRDRMITPPTNEAISPSNPIKLFEHRDAFFANKNDAGYGVYSTTGIGRVRTPQKTSEILDNGFYRKYIKGETINSDIDFIGMTNEPLGSDVSKAVVLGFSEISTWKNWYIGFFNTFNGSPTLNEPSKFSLKDGEEPNNYMIHWHEDIGFGVMYEDVVSNAKVFVSMYEVVTNPCPLAPQILEQPKNQTYCEGNVALSALKVKAIPYEDGKSLTYQWYSNTTNSNKNGTKIVGATQANYTPSTAPAVGSKLYYYVEITETDGLKSISRAAEISIGSNAVISGVKTISAGGKLQLSVDMPAGVWASTDTSIATISASGEVLAIAHGTTTITYTAGRCFAETQIVVTKSTAPIVPIPTPTPLNCDLKFNNGISPNNDGLNDYFHIENITCYPQNKLRIFNRWGKKVFEIENYDNQNRVFAGNSNQNSVFSEKLPQGVYYYILDIQTDTSKIEKGWLLIME